MASADVDDGFSDPLPSGNTRPILELVLLAIIQGHFGKDDPQGNQKRLRDAVRALTGKKIFASPLMDPDRDAIERLAGKARDQKYKQWCATHLPASQPAADFDGKKSLSMLAAEVVAERRSKAIADFSESDVSFAKLLVEKYTGAYYRKQNNKKPRSNSGKKFERMWQYTFFEHDHVAESIEMQAAERILAELSECGVPFSR